MYSTIYSFLKSISNKYFKLLLVSSVIVVTVLCAKDTAQSSRESFQLI